MTMRRLFLILLAVPALSVAGCDRLRGGTTTSDLRNVEIQPGTASDEMVTLDQAEADGTAIDPSTATRPTPPRSESDDAADGGAAGSATASDDQGGAPAAGDTSDQSLSPRPGDSIVRPPAAPRAETTRPAPAKPANRPATQRGADQTERK